MKNDAYLRRLDRELRKAEREVFDRLRPLLVNSIVQVRQILLTAIPDEGISRRLAYLAVTPLLEQALIEFNDTFRDVLSEELQLLQTTTLAMAHDRLRGSASTYDFLPGGDLLRLIKVFGGWSLQEYFQRRSPSQFMKEVLKLVNRTVERGLMEGLRTAEIVSQIVPEVINRTGRAMLTIRRGTVLNAIRNRVEGTISQAIWSLATLSEQIVWPEADVPRWIWTAILDDRICPTCEALDNRVEFRREDFPFVPPVHPNCRCRTLPYATT